MKCQANQEGIETIAMPRIGAGYGGLSFNMGNVRINESTPWHPGTTQEALWDLLTATQKSTDGSMNARWNLLRTRRLIVTNPATPTSNICTGAISTGSLTEARTRSKKQCGIVYPPKLFGSAPIMKAVKTTSPKFTAHQRRIPPPMQALRN